MQESDQMLPFGNTVFMRELVSNASSLTISYLKNTCSEEIAVIKLGSLT